MGAGLFMKKQTFLGLLLIILAVGSMGAGQSNEYANCWMTGSQRWCDHGWYYSVEVIKHSVWWKIDLDELLKDREYFTQTLSELIRRQAYGKRLPETPCIAGEIFLLLEPFGILVCHVQ